MSTYRISVLIGNAYVPEIPMPTDFRRWVMDVLSENENVLIIVRDEEFRTVLSVNAFLPFGEELPSWTREINVRTEFNHGNFFAYKTNSFRWDLLSGNAFPV